MIQLSLAAALLMLAEGQAVTTDRPRSFRSDNRVIVVSADQNVAVALGQGFELDDGSQRFYSYKVFRHGVAESNWTTPAYEEGAIDVRCEDRTVRVVFQKLYRGNGDPITTVQFANTDAPFSRVTDPALQRQFDVGCGDDPRVSYEQPFLFTEAYGLNDGRTPRVGPGPMVP